MTTWLLGLALVLAPPEANAQWQRAPATPVQDELPDGELDLPDGDEDEPAAKPAPKPTPEPTKVPPKPLPDAEVTPPPDERRDPSPPREPVVEPAVDPTADPAVDPAQPWVDEDLEAEKDPSRRPVDDDLHEIRVGGDGGRVSQVDEDDALLQSPLFWGGVAGGAVLLVGGGVGAGVLIYSLLNADKGSVVITLE